MQLRSHGGCSRLERRRSAPVRFESKPSARYNLYLRQPVMHVRADHIKCSCYPPADLGAYVCNQQQHDMKECCQARDSAHDMLKAAEAPNPPGFAAYDLCVSANTVTSSAAAIHQQTWGHMFATSNSMT